MSACARAGRGLESFSLLDQMSEISLAPDVTRPQRHPKAVTDAKAMRPDIGRCRCQGDQLQRCGQSMRSRVALGGSTAVFAPNALYIEP